MGSSQSTENNPQAENSDRPGDATETLERSMIALPDSPSSLFDKLPLEIRQQIYRNFLHSVPLADGQVLREVNVIVKKRLNPYSKYKVGPREGADWRVCIKTLPKFPFPPNTAALLTASHMLQSEVLERLLYNTVLHFDSSDALFGLLMQGGINLIKAIRHVTVKGHGSYNIEALTGLKLCARLETLTIIGARITYMHTDRNLTITTLRNNQCLELVAGLESFSVEVNPDVLNTDDRMAPLRIQETWGPTAYRPFTRGSHPDFQRLSSTLQRPRVPVTDEAIVEWLNKKAPSSKIGGQAAYILTVLAERPMPTTLEDHFNAEAEDPEDVLQDAGDTAGPFRRGWTYVRSFL